MEDTQNDRHRRTKEKEATRSGRNPRVAGSILVLAAVLTIAGCYHNPIVDTSDYEQGPAPLRMPSPAKSGDGCACYEDSLTGGQVFTMYCAYCHNAPTLGERSFANFKNVASHMRVRANLTGQEYAKVMDFMRRCHDVPAADGIPETSPKRLTFSQPLSELRPPPPVEGKREPQAAAGDNQGQ